MTPWCQRKTYPERTKLWVCETHVGREENILRRNKLDASKNEFTAKNKMFRIHKNK